MKIGIVACGAVVRELTTIAERQGWDFELTAVPVQFHSRPERIAPAVEKKLDEWAGRFDLILVGYADCGTRGALDDLLDGYPHVARIPGPHCYEFYGGSAFHEQTEREPGTFYLTDFLARHFDGLVVEELGLDRYPELRDVYFGNYRELLYMQQSDENDQSERARSAAERLGLSYRRTKTGMEELEKRVVALVDTINLGGVMTMSDKVCSVCESPLTTDAIREGRCQCCGSQLSEASEEEDETTT